MDRIRSSVKLLPHISAHVKGLWGAQQRSIDLIDAEKAHLRDQQSDTPAGSVTVGNYDRVVRQRARPSSARQLQAVLAVKSRQLGAPRSRWA